MKPNDTKVTGVDFGFGVRQKCYFGFFEQAKIMAFTIGVGRADDLPIGLVDD
jgi:hypothetical protein